MTNNLMCFFCSGNAASVFLLTRKELSSFFNHLLAALCLFDMIYLFTMMLEALRNLGLESSTHTIIFPSFLYPINAIIMMASIYMTLVIGLERLGLLLDYVTTTYIHNIVCEGT